MEESDDGRPGTRDPRVTAALARVPRARFVAPELAAHAAEDRPLPIGEGQTISQPLVVAWMTDALRVSPGLRVLEVGTGSGFQAAVLAELGARVWTVEVRPALAARARRTLDALGYREVRTRVGDGAEGWPEQAPFDAICVTAAAWSLPPALLAQLRPGGRLCVPLGAPEDVQRLVLVVRRADGSLERRVLGDVRFVPLVTGSTGATPGPTSEGARGM